MTLLKLESTLIDRFSFALTLLFLIMFINDVVVIFCALIMRTEMEVFICMKMRKKEQEKEN